METVCDQVNRGDFEHFFSLVLCFITAAMLWRFAFSRSLLLLYFGSTIQLEMLFLQGPTGPHGNPGQPGLPGPKVSDMKRGNPFKS